VHGREFGKELIAFLLDRNPRSLRHESYFRKKLGSISTRAESHIPLPLCNEHRVPDG
jgi:hypothetical protein